MHWTIGEADADILDLVVAEDGTLVIIKEDGVYRLDQTGIPFNLTPGWREMRFSKHGSGATAWLGNVYVPAGRASLWEFDLFRGFQRQVGASHFGPGVPEYSGRVSAVHADGSWLFAFQLDPQSAGQTGSQLVAGKPSTGNEWRWGSLAEIDAGQVEFTWISNLIGARPRMYWSSRDLAADDVAQA